jgi:GTP-binding protein
MIADLKRAEAEEAAKKKPTEFPTEAAIRTDDFQTAPVTNITPSDENKP